MTLCDFITEKPFVCVKITISNESYGGFTSEQSWYKEKVKESSH